MKPITRVAAAALTFAALAAAGATAVLVIGGPALAQETALAVPPEVVSRGMLAAAIAAGASALGAAYAVAQVGSAAVGAIAEKPELLGRVLILVGLAEGIAIYGLIVAILILNRLG